METLSKVAAVLYTRTPLAPLAKLVSVATISGVVRLPTYTSIDELTDRSPVRS
jgi:hypothetical protein